MFYPLILGSCRGAASANLWVRVVLFLRKQVRDMRVQELLKELIIGVATLRDLARSIIVKIHHSVEGGDIEQSARTSKQFFYICDCSSLSQLTCVLYFAYSYYSYSLYD